jgi:hypothetical protein
MDEGDKARAERIINDPRTNEQLNAATLVLALQLATLADPTRMFGSRLPAVRVIVPQEALKFGVGFGRLQESGHAVPLNAVERMICITGTLTVTIDDSGQAIDVVEEPDHSCEANPHPREAQRRPPLLWRCGFVC